MRKERHQTKNLDFAININDDGTWPDAKIHSVVLMDIRDELQKLNRLLHCPNFIGIPRELRLIKQRLPVRRKPKKKRS